MTLTFRSSLPALVGLLLLASAPAALAQDAGLPLPTRRAADEDATGAIARRFYDAFCRGDVASMERLYAPNVRFKDEIFTFSDRAGTMGMWRVLVDPSSGGRFSYTLLGVEGETATVRWIADYEFLGRPVHNEITARLVIRGGQIVEHHDSFSWERWARQALPLGRFSSFGPIERVIKAGLRVGLRLRAASMSRQPASGGAPAAEAPRAPSRGLVDAVPGADGK